MVVDRCDQEEPVCALKPCICVVFPNLWTVYEFPELSVQVWKAPVPKQFADAVPAGKAKASKIPTIRRRMSDLQFCRMVLNFNLT